MYKRQVYTVVDVVPTYEIIPINTNINENTTFTVDFKTTYVPSDTQLYFELVKITTDDFDSDLSGITLDDIKRASISYDYGSKFGIGSNNLTPLTIIRMNGTITKILNINGFFLSSIGSQFNYDEDIVRVIIGDNVTSIGTDAFRYCDALHSVTIGDNVTSIGINAFRQCTALQSVTIGNSCLLYTSPSPRD